MNRDLAIIGQKKQELEDLKETVIKELKTYEDVKGKNIRFSKRKNGYQYYLENDEGKRVYIKKKDMRMVGRVLQRRYYEDTYKALCDLIRAVDSFKKAFDYKKLANTYSRICPAKKYFIKPIDLPDELFIQEWESMHQGDQNMYPEKGIYETDKGEVVRSKSEKIIADMLNKFNVPYKYEPLLELKGGKVIYPDFVILNVKKRKTIYWEHLGLVSDGEYAIRNMEKLIMYEKSGYDVGVDILISMESNSSPLDVKLIEQKIKKYCI